MKLGIQTGSIQTDLGVDGAYHLIRETGFDAVDANIDELFEPADIRKRLRSKVFGDMDMLLETVRPWKDAALKYGLDNYQTHAPFPSVPESMKPVVVTGMRTTWSAYCKTASAPPIISAAGTW